MSESFGQRILEEIIKQPMFRMECPSHPDAGCIAIWNGNAAEQIEAAASRDEDASYWKNRSLQAEDLIERMQTWEEVLPKQERLEQLQSNVARIRTQFRREGVSEFCAELVPLCKDDSWVSIEERKPPLSEPIVQVLFDNGEIAESQFYIGAFENNFLSFCTKRPDSKITHWRPKKSRP